MKFSGAVAEEEKGLVA